MDNIMKERIIELLDTLEAYCRELPYVLDSTDETILALRNKLEKIRK